MFGFIILKLFQLLMDAQGAVFAWPLLLEQRTVLPAPKVAEAVWAASAVPSPPKERQRQRRGANPISRHFFDRMN